MADPLDLQIDARDRLYDPPLIDALHYERDPDGFSVTFVPSVGDDPTRHVFVRRDSAEGRQIAAYLYRIQDLIGKHVRRLTHSGGGDYVLHLADGQTLSLSDERPDEQWAPEVTDRISQIASVAEMVFSIAHVGR